VSPSASAAPRDGATNSAYPAESAAQPHCAQGLQVRTRIHRRPALDDTRDAGCNGRTAHPARTTTLPEFVIGPCVGCRDLHGPADVHAGGRADAPHETQAEHTERVAPSSTSTERKCTRVPLGTTEFEVGTGSITMGHLHPLVRCGTPARDIRVILDRHRSRSSTAWRATVLTWKDATAPGQVRYSAPWGPTLQSRTKPQDVLGMSRLVIGVGVIVTGTPGADEHH
jgi:hypothetical protein